MNSKDTSSQKQGASNVADNNISNKNVTHTDHGTKTTSNNASNYPFYTPPDEFPKARITSN